MEGRARNQRDHGRRGPAPQEVPRRAERGRTHPGRGLDPLEAARRRHVGEFLRGTRGPLHHGRVLRGPSTGRGSAGRIAHAHRAGVHPRPWRDRTHSRVHPAVVGAVRHLVVGRAAGPPARADLLPDLVPVQCVRLGLLGAADHRPPHDRGIVPAGAAARRLARRDQERSPQATATSALVVEGPVRTDRRTAARIRTPSPPAAAPGGAPARNRMDHPPTGSRRVVGRHPAAVGLLDDRPEPHGLLGRSPRHASGLRRTGRVHDP